jgi:hypothetical protein
MAHKHKRQAHVLRLLPSSFSFFKRGDDKQAASVGLGVGCGAVERRQRPSRIWQFAVQSDRPRKPPAGGYGDRSAVTRET